jgi:hypothetical protein
MTPRETYLEDCRRCEDPVAPELLTDGLCRNCMIDAGLVRCADCQRLTPREIVVLCGSDRLCPYCHADRGRAEQRGVR